MSAIHRTAKWGAFTRKVRPLIQATLPAPCVSPKPGCPGLVQPTDKWDVSHRIDHWRDPWQLLTIEAVGPGHRSCNRWRGAKDGRAQQLQRKADGQKLPREDSGW